jgi:hypothetical protein
MRPSASFVDASGISIMPDNNMQAGFGIIFTVDSGEGGVVPDGGSPRPYFDKPTTWIITPRVSLFNVETVM